MQIGDKGEGLRVDTTGQDTTGPATPGRGTGSPHTAAVDATDRSADPRRNAIVTSGAHGARRVHSGGTPDSLSIRGNAPRLDMPPRAVLESVYARGVASMRESSSSTRNTPVDTILDASASIILHPSWDPASFRDVAFAAAMKVQNSDVVSNLSGLMRLLALRCGIQAHELNAKLPDDISRRIHRGIVDDVAVLWGTEALQASLAQSSLRYASGAAGDVVGVLSGVNAVRDELAKYDRSAKVGSEENAQAAYAILERLTGEVRETLDSVFERAAGKYSPSQLTELLALSKLVTHAIEGAQHLMVSAYKYKAGPEKFQAKPESDDVNDILKMVNDHAPESAKRFGFYKLDYAMEQLGARLAVLTLALDGKLPPLVVDRYTQARMGSLLENMSKNKATLPAGHETLPSFDLTFAAGDFSDYGRGGVNGHFTFKVAPDDTLYVIGRDRNDEVWQGMWPHHLAHPSV